ncbi:hypothetical protein B0I08_104129 [Glaciihabitans tibetensis]|uniref:Tetracyclin repressor-like C-terminal domain-containing protein n=1 Tax=Glaciihabitans tibetensis TaxID=1266600 RepID=A0A2T0VE16_9MICO|nr:hypothetical protein [Glaciihabitans tibetensis]PRY68427.1 hypothetical protein B0I08_104129 [Glaciihabitans tibetensis]
MRAGQLSEILSKSLADRVVLCDLFGAQGGVLEHNVSVEVVKQHKRASLAGLTTMTDLVRSHLPELGDGAQLFCLMSLVTAGALSSYVPPPPSLLAAYKDEPALGVLHLELRDDLRVALMSSLVGVLRRVRALLFVDSAWQRSRACEARIGRRLEGDSAPELG